MSQGAYVCTLQIVNSKSKKYSNCVSTTATYIDHKQHTQCMLNHKAFSSYLLNKSGNSKV